MSKKTDIDIFPAKKKKKKKDYARAVKATTNGSSGTVF